MSGLELKAVDSALERTSAGQSLYDMVSKHGRCLVEPIQTADGRLMAAIIKPLSALSLACGEVAVLPGVNGGVARLQVRIAPLPDLTAEIVVPLDVAGIHALIGQLRDALP